MRRQLDRSVWPLPVGWCDWHRERPGLARCPAGRERQQLVQVVSVLQEMRARLFGFADRMTLVQRMRWGRLRRNRTLRCRQHLRSHRRLRALGLMSTRSPSRSRVSPWPIHHRLVRSPARILVHLGQDRHRLLRRKYLFQEEEPAPVRRRPAAHATLRIGH